MSVTTEHFNKAVKIAQEYGATSLLLFGSALKDPLNANDIDLACDGVDDTRFFHLAAELENTLMIPVDLVPLASGGPFIEYIKKYGRDLI